MIPTVLGWALDFYVGADGGYTRPPPAFTPLDHEVALGVTPNDPSSYGAGVDVAVGVHRAGVDTPIGRIGLDLPLLQLRFMDLGKHRTNGRNTDGTPTTLALDEATGTIGVLGIGAHLEWKRLLVRASIRPVFEWSIASGDVTPHDGSSTSESVSTNNPAFSFGADATLQACGLATPAVGLCAQVTPRLSRTLDGEHGLGNGVFFGIGVQVW